MATNTAPMNSSPFSQQQINNSSYFNQKQIIINITPTSHSNLNNRTQPPNPMTTNSAPSDSSSTQNKSSPSSLSIQSTEEVEKVFNRFDTNGDGKISVTELGAVFSSLGSSFSDEDELRRMMDEVDSDHDGFISLTEFAAFCSSSSAEDGGVSELRDAFKLYDQDQNGLISASELHLVLNRLGMNCSVEDCHRMIRSVDSDGDGNVNFEEFLKMMTTANANNSNASPL